MALAQSTVATIFGVRMPAADTRLGCGVVGRAF
jgi:hypothetical protein